MGFNLLGCLVVLVSIAAGAAGWAVATGGLPHDNETKIALCIGVGVLCADLLYRSRSRVTGLWARWASAEGGAQVILPGWAISVVFIGIGLGPNPAAADAPAVAVEPAGADAAAHYPGGFGSPEFGYAPGGYTDPAPAIPPAPAAAAPVRPSPVALFVICAAAAAAAVAASQWFLAFVTPAGPPPVPAAGGPSLEIDTSGPQRGNFARAAAVPPPLPPAAGVSPAARVAARLGGLWRTTWWMPFLVSGIIFAGTYALYCYISYEEAHSESFVLDEFTALLYEAGGKPLALLFPFGLGAGFFGFGVWRVVQRARRGGWSEASESGVGNVLGPAFVIFLFAAAFLLMFLKWLAG